MAGLVQDLLLCLFHAQVKQWGSLDSFCSHPRDLQKQKKRILEPKQGTAPRCSLCLRFSALHFPARQKPAAGRAAQPKLLFAVRIRPVLHILFLPPSISFPSSGVLSILCKSSNQHAQVLFNFTASRVALISSSNLGCILFFFFFKPNGRFSKRRASRSWLFKQFEVFSAAK